MASSSSLDREEEEELALSRFLEFVEAADIKFVTADYLQRLHRRGRVWPRRQEAERDGELFQPTRQMLHFSFIAISHCWESREHPDPHGYQLAQIVHHIQPAFPTMGSESAAYYDRLDRNPRDQYCYKLDGQDRCCYADRIYFFSLTTCHFTNSNETQSSRIAFNAAWRTCICSTPTPDIVRFVLCGASRG